MAQIYRNSVQWVVMRLLAYLGVTSLLAEAPPADTPDASNRTYVTPGLLDDLAGILSTALQEIANDGPANLSEASQGFTLFAPATITLAVVPGNAATQLVSGFLPWMVGCSVVITGDGYLNEFVNGTGRLRRPYGGSTTGNVAATVYGNAIRLPVSVAKVLEPVILSGHGELTACTNREEFDRASGAAVSCSAGGFFFGRPTWYYVESQFDEDLPYQPLTLRFAHCPGGPLAGTYRARMEPPTVDVEDIGDDTYDPAVMLPGVAGSHTENIFLPYCLQLLTGHPLWKPDNPNAAQEIARRYQAAKLKLGTFRPQAGGSAARYAYRVGG